MQFLEPPIFEASLQMPPDAGNPSPRVVALARGTASGSQMKQRTRASGHKQKKSRQTTVPSRKLFGSFLKKRLAQCLTSHSWETPIFNLKDLFGAPNRVWICPHRVIAREAPVSSPVQQNQRGSQIEIPIPKPNKLSQQRLIIRQLRSNDSLRPPQEL